MRVTCERASGERFDVETGSPNTIPLLQVDGVLYVLRAGVLGFIDNISRGGSNDMLYHETIAREVSKL